MDGWMNYQHWQLNIDEQNICWLTLDKQNATINTLDIEVLAEFQELLDKIETLAPRGLIIQSGKKNGFMAGADIQQFRKVETFDDAYELIQQGQIVFQQLANCACPTLALIQGFCLGGGLELALACDYRVAVNDNKTKLGLPEVMLGVHPGWGGTVRLPRMIGAIKAFDLILSGRSVSAKTAQTLGLVDSCVPLWQAIRAALHFILTEPPIRQAKGFEAMTNWDAVRPWLAKIIRKKLAKKVNREHYPAPFITIDNWQDYGVKNDMAFTIEAKSIAQLLITDTTRNLVRVFNLQEKLKALHRDVTFKPAHVHVVGAGVMGGDIAAWCALKGMMVTVQDQNPEVQASALERANILFKKQLKDASLITAAKDRLIADNEGLGIHKADLVIEAIVEKKEAKETLFRALEKSVRPETILATNTSTIPLNEIGIYLRDKTKLIGAHFFNPVSRMPLVEVVFEHETDPHIIAKICGFVRAIDKLPIEVRSAPGFLVNRLLMPYLLESMLLLEEGVPKAFIDKAVVEFGMPMGPIELADTVGLDVCLYALENLPKNQVGEEIQKLLRKRVEKGHLGKKTGRGFYRYKNNKPVKEAMSAQYQLPEDALDRMILRMVNEAVACLRENIVQDSDFLDAGMIFGAGFPPFRGGPIHYAKEQGERLILQRLNQLVQRYGDRFFPDAGWSTLDVA